MKAKGFGFFARYVDRYALASVIGLVRHLALQRGKDCGFLAGLRKAAFGCALVYRKGEVSLTSQAIVGLSVAMSAMEEAVAVAAAAPLVDEEDDAREAGAELTVQDFIDTFTSTPKTLDFWSLDQATRMVFHRMVQEQTAIFCDGRPSSPIATEQELTSDIGKGVYDGYIIGRRLWGTHDEAISFSAGEPQAQANGQRMLKELETVRPVDILQAAGKHVTDLLGNLVTHYGEEGVYGRLADRERARQLLLVTILNGFSLSIAERRVSGVV